MMSWFWGKPAPSAEQEAARVAAANAETLEKLQQRHDVNAAMITQYGANVQRLEQQRLGATAPAKAEEYKMARDRAFKTMRTMQKQQATLSGQIDTLLGVTTNVQAMSTNMELHGRIKESNTVTSRLAGSIDIDDVHETMDEVGEHQKQHEEVSDALAGRFTGSIADPEEEASDLASFLGQGTYIAAATPSAAVAQTSMEARDRARLEAEDRALEELLSAMPKLPSSSGAAVPASRQAMRGK